jgi:hypothetical protein
MDGSGAVVLNLDTAAYHGLNAIGSVIWRLLGDGDTFGGLIDGLRDAIDDPPAHLEDEVTAFLRSLEERDLVVIGSEPVAQA